MPHKDLDAADRWQSVNLRLLDACARFDRKQQDIRLIAVSKYHSSSAIQKLTSFGQIWFGENYVDELCRKVDELKDHAPAICWSFIGTLQSNKIKRLVQSANEIQTVSSHKHLSLIDKYANEMGLNPFPVFIGVNAAGETSKSGVLPEHVEELAKAAAPLTGVRLRGIMVIPPRELSCGPSVVAKQAYDGYRQLADGIGDGLLSLGMSADIEVALAAGTDVVRIGTALFGSRPKKE